MRAFEDLTLLRAFVSIVECGSISAAAPKLKAKDMSIHVVYAGQRVLSVRVSSFIDFAVRHLGTFPKVDRCRSLR
jgi:hypothetical protein